MAIRESVEEVCPVCEGTGHLLKDGCPLCQDDVTLDVAPAPPTIEGLCTASLAELSAVMLEKLKKFKPVVVADMDPALHYLAPHVPKVTWDALGDLVSSREKSALGEVPGRCWISLRLDGSGFSKAVRSMRRHGVLEPEGFSDRFAVCMQSCLRGLMEKFACRLGYTQSDEMIVFIPPASVVRGEQMPHFHNGRVTKLTTLAAGHVTSHFVVQLCQLCVARGTSLDGFAQVLPHFDCRLGYYDSWEEARSLLMWRAHDCSVNGVSDAVYHTRGSKPIQGLDKRAKVEWLWKQGLLPLPKHQAYGTVLVRVKRMVTGFNPQKEETVTVLRGCIEQIDGPVLELMRQGALPPRDPVG